MWRGKNLTDHNVSTKCASVCVRQPKWKNVSFWFTLRKNVCVIPFDIYYYHHYLYSRMVRKISWWAVWMFIRVDIFKCYLSDTSIHNVNNGMIFTEQVTKCSHYNYSIYRNLRERLCMLKRGIVFPFSSVHGLCLIHAGVCYMHLFQWCVCEISFGQQRWSSVVKVMCTTVTLSTNKLLFV